jgi:hypothetical protein
VSRKDFPLEHEGPLDFAQLIRALDTVVGERVCLPKAASGSGLEVGGTLRRFDVELEQPQISGSEALSRCVLICDAFNGAFNGICKISDSRAPSVILYHRR